MSLFVDFRIVKPRLGALLFSKTRELMLHTRERSRAPVDTQEPKWNKVKRAVSFDIIAIDKDCDCTQWVNQKEAQPDDKYTRKAPRFPAPKDFGHSH